jgi:hypothetical protein
MFKFLCILASVALAQLASAFDTSQSVTATAINAVPFAITAPGNYYLVHDVSFTSPVGAAIFILADGVVLDLNGRTIRDTGGGLTIGVYVGNHEDVTVQNGNIDNFGQAGVFFNGTSGSDKNQKNLCRNVRLNNDEIGVLSISGQSNEVAECVIDGGDIGIFVIDDSGGTRLFRNTLEAQHKTQLFGVGIGILDVSGKGILSEFNLISKGDNALGEFLASPTDKYRDESFVAFPANHPIAGGVDEGNSSL